MANMTFKTNLLPNSTTLEYSLGSEDKQWNIYGELNGNASSADKWKNARTLTIGNKSQNIDGSSDISYSLHDINYTNIAIGTATSWNYTTPGVYGVASSAEFTGEGHPESNNGGLTPYRYGQLLVYRASSYGISQFYISHHDSSSSSYGIKYRTGWNSNYESTWSTLLDSTNYTQYTVTKTGEGASGTWDISITGNAATATKCGDGSCYGYFHHSNELNFGGSNNSTTIYFGYRAMDSRAIPTNFIFGSSTGTATIQCSSVYLGSGTTYSVSSSGLVCAGSSRINPSQGALYLGNSGNQSWVYVQDICSQTSKDNWKITQDGIGTFKTCKGAVWNDYAEMRNVPEAQNNIEFNINKKGIEESRTYPQAGRCVKEKGNGEMQLSTKRLEYGCKIISDTFGFCIGETDNCKTPIAVTGRVLAYPYEDIEILKQHIGEPVCSGPNGTISLMTHEEEKEWPSKILGIISEIPNYNIWHCGVEGKESIKVNGRIWIYVR